MTLAVSFTGRMEVTPGARPTREFEAVIQALLSRTGGAVEGIVASDVINTPNGTIAAVNVQAAIDELDAEKATTAAVALKADADDLAAHEADTANPHSVTKAQVGLSNVDNTSDANKPVSTAQQTALDLKANDADLTAHVGDTGNPHSVTAAQAGADPTGTAAAAVTAHEAGADPHPQYLMASGALTVGTLPSAVTAGVGARNFVTDANATTFNSVVASGGANKVPVFSDGADWRIG